jgi:predicted nucleic acid-binding protein
MILADTSIWVDHLRSGDDIMAGLLGSDRVLMHPFVRGEIALGQLRRRPDILQALDALPLAMMASDTEVYHLIEEARLFASGIGYFDAHLLAAVRLTGSAKLWTRDKRLALAAERLSVAARPVY